MTTAEAAVIVVICLFAAVGVWRVMIRQELTWMQYASLLAAILVFPVHMVRSAFRRRP